MKVDDPFCLHFEMEGTDHIAQDNNNGDQQGRPLEAQEYGFEQGYLLVKTVFEIHFYNPPSTHQTKD